MKQLSEQERVWCEIMETSTNPEELMETAQKLKMKPLSLEKAKELVELNKRVLSLRTAQDEPKKGFMELLLEASATEDLKEKETIYAKIEELEIKKEREALQKEKGS